MGEVIRPQGTRKQDPLHSALGAMGCLAGTLRGRTCVILMDKAVLLKSRENHAETLHTTI